MKLFSTILATALVATLTHAQTISETRTFEGVSTPPLNVSGAEMESDTLGPPSSCASNSVTLNLGRSSNGGYISGTNGHGDQEKATTYAVSGYRRVTDALVYFGAKEHVTNGSFVAHVYQLDTSATTVNALMGNPIATSDPVSVASIDTVAGNITAFHFSTPATVKGAFAIGIQVDNGGDTVGIIHSQDGCGRNLALEKLQNGNWGQVSSRWSNGNVIFFIFAVVEYNIGIEESTIATQSLRAFPNPATDQVTIAYDLTENSHVTLRVTDIQGRVIAEQDEAQTAGEQRFELNTSGLSTGTYFYSIQNGETVLNGKFVIRH